MNTVIQSSDSSAAEAVKSGDSMIYVIKKDGTKDEFDIQKIITAVNKSAGRIVYKFADSEIDFLCRFAQEKAMQKAAASGGDTVTIQEMHNIVEGALDQVNPEVAKSYRDYSS